MENNQVIINMKNVFSQIIGLDNYTKKIILQKLSYIEEGFCAPSKTIYLYNVTNNITYTGLIPYVINILNRFTIPYKINDLRNKPKYYGKYKIQKPFEARDYQQTIVDNIGNRDLVQCATGGGKTFLMAKFIEKHNVQHIVVIAPKVSLMLQIQEEFEKFLGIKIGILGGGFNNIQDITICTPQSATKELLERCEMIMYDECLEYNQKVLMENGEYKKIGDLVKNKSNEKVMSYNHKTKQLESKKIIGHSKTKLKSNNKKMMKIKIRKENGEIEIIKCTNNHKIWIESEQRYIKAEDLIKGQKIKSIKNNK